jgi:hypothetical protein
MKGDFTRDTFDPLKHFSRVLMQQGRVTLDADWNEQADITAHRTETEARDVIGLCGAPKHNPGFKISNGSGGDFTIGAGRFYVDGILCQNNAAVSFTNQSDLPGTTSIKDSGSYLVYLDVWQRHLTALDDPEIREVALGGPDTATRTKTVWQVKTLRIGDIGTAVTCADDLASWNELIAPSTGQLSARTRPDRESDKPSILPLAAGYRGSENHLYRVEIHEAGELGDGSSAPTFKWSRDNASFVAAVQSIGNGKIKLRTGRHDTPLGFGLGKWIEITDDRHDLLALPGTLARIAKVEDLVLTVDTANAIPPGELGDVDLALHGKVRRWDSRGLQDVSVPAGNDHFLSLEDGVEVKFENGTYRTGDYWMIPARTATGNVEWPHDTAVPPNPVSRLPHGIVHHFCRLAIIEFSNGNVTVMEDCCRQFSPLTELQQSSGYCTNTVWPTEGADKKYFGKYRGSVIDNIDPLQMGRLMVQVPAISGLTSTWAMPCFPVTGKQMGLWVLPLVGSAVWVEFEQGNPDYPIWTGCFPGSATDLPVLALAGNPASPSIVLQTGLQNTVMISDMPGPTGGILLKTTTGAMISINENGITISNGKGAVIAMNGPEVNINAGALSII